VTLTVTDNEGATDDVSLEVNVTAPTGNQPPTADFDVACVSLDCTFTNRSTDADGTFTSVWNFGDGSPLSDNTNTSHSYVADELTEFTVTLTVTDDDGAPATKTEVISISPPATLTCEDGTPDCELLIEVPSTVVVTLVSEDCELDGNTFKVIIAPPAPAPPVEEILFTDGCNETAPQSFNLQNGAVIVAGTVITAQVISGGTNLELPPAIRVTGDFATGWTLEFDDGAKAGPPPEPDFNDLILTIRATP
jgi:PKD repeat protein